MTIGLKSLNPQNPRVAFKGRFEHMFSDKDLLIATAPSPQHSVVGYINLDLKGEVKRSIISEAAMKARPVGQTGVAEEHTGSDPFNYVRQEDIVATQDRHEEDIEKTFDDWNRLQGKSSSRVSFDQYPFFHKSVWLEMFIK
jgi:hypothetical protein